MSEVTSLETIITSVSVLCTALLTLTTQTVNLHTVCLLSEFTEGIM